MMMKKTTSALAVAALLGTGAASAATLQIDGDTSVNLYGNIQIGYYDNTNSAGNDVSDVVDNGTTLGVSVEHSAGNGLTAFAKLEEDGFDASDGASDQFTDEAFLGVRGAFGSVQFGRDDSIYDKMIDGYWGVSDGSGPTKIKGGSDNNSLQYFSPNLNGASFAVSAELIGDNDDAIALANAADSTDFASTTDVNGESAPTASLAAAFEYSINNVTLTAAIDQRANAVNEIDPTITTDTGDNYDFLDDPIYGLAGSVDLGTMVLKAGYQKDDRNDSTEGNSTDIGSLGFSTSVAGNDLYGSVQSIDVDGSSSRTEVFAGYRHYVSGNMYVVGEYAARDKTNDEGDQIYLGAYYGW